MTSNKLKEMKDHLGRTVTYHFPPRKIISLCPAITETLYALDLEKNIVGRTKYCIYPKEKCEQATIVGGTKQINLEKIKELSPDLIIAEKEENTKEIVELLEQYYPVYVAEVQSVGGAHKMILDIGIITDREREADNLSKDIKQGFLNLPTVNDLRAAYVIWRKPYMVVGRDTYINSVLEELGFINPFAALKDRYPVVDALDFKNAQLDYIFLSSEPFPFSEKYFDEFQEIMPDAKIVIVDGEMFWYGTRMIEAAEYFRKMFSL